MTKITFPARPALARFRLRQRPAQYLFDGNVQLALSGMRANEAREKAAKEAAKAAAKTSASAA
jgi:hypothetical protein